MKKISLFLTLTMLCSMLVMPIHSSAAGKIFEEDFESYSSVSDMPIGTGIWEWGDNPSSEKSEIVTEDGGNKAFALKLTSDTNSIWLDRRLSSSGNEVLKIKMSVKTDTTALRIPLSVYGAGGDFMFAIFLDGKIKTLNGEQTEFASYEANKWYDLETDFNFETKTYDITVIDEAGTKSVTENVPFGNAGMSNIDRIRLQCWDNLNGNVFFDDFSAESYVKESEVIPAGAISDNFNGYNSVSDMSAWNFSGAQNKAEIVSDVSGKALALHLDSATDSIWAIRPFTQINTGNVKIKTSVKTDNTGLTVPLGIHCDSDPWFVYAMFTNGVIKTEDGTEFATYEANQWYKVEADFNLSEKTYNVTIIGPDGVERETKDVPFRNQSLSAISSVWLQCWSKIDANAYFDDFYVEQYYKAPSLPTSKVKVYDSNNEVVENWNSIPSDISSISLDFSTPMKSSSFTTDTVKLTNTSNNENVSYMGTLDGSVYTIVPSSLAANTTYNLLISKDIENISGAKMAEDVTVVLTTSDAVVDPPASPDPSTSILVDEKFDNYSSVNDLTNENRWYWGQNDSQNKSEIKTEGENKVFALNLDSSTDNISLLRDFDEVTDKYLKVSVDAKSSDTELTVPISINDYNIFVMFDHAKIKANDTEIMTYEANKWYNITAYFDIAAKTYDVVITDENGQKTVLKNATTSQTKIANVKMQCWSKKNATAYFDNLLVEQLDKKPVIEEDPGTIPDGIDITDDFESYNTVNDMGVYGITGKELSSVVEEAGNKFFRLGLNSETDSIWADRSFVKVDEGILNVKTRFKSSDTTLTVPLSVWSSNDKSFFYILVTEGKIYAGDHAEQLAPLKVDTWYDVDAVFNLNTKTYTVSISDGTDTIKSGNLIFGNTDMTDINFVRMQCWSKVNANADFDNLSIKSSMAVPEITENSVTFYNANGDATNELTNVSTGTSKIVIDFKTYMDADSLDGIKLINKKTNTEVAVTAQKTQKTYEMVLDKLLEGNTTYALIIPGTVKNRNDIALGEDKTVTFVTESSAGGLSVKIANISNGEQEVSTLTDLIAAGAATTISLNYQNGTEPQNDTNICVITSYYSGERLVKTSVMNKTVSKDTVNTVLKYDMPIESKDGVDCVKVFVWDTVNNMKPYCKNAVFK
ncbi:MAG: Ig-like domain-containing protein [Clostridia bacterium]|nr:Ig-like domain-containing protein [Clostridia bacterium]